MMPQGVGWETDKYVSVKRCVYLGGLDILSEKKSRQVLETSKRRERRALRQLRGLGIALPKR